MNFVFPDSKREIEMEGVSFLTLTLLRGWYEQNYPGKPVKPVDPLDTLEDGNVNTPEFKKARDEYLKDQSKYEMDLKNWTGKMNGARWAATKVYYASCLKSEVDKEAVEKAISQVAPFIDLRQAILGGYKEQEIPFDESILDKYIYLFHVCITNSGEQTLFENALMSGSAPTQEAVQQSLFRLLGKV